MSEHYSELIGKISDKEAFMFFMDFFIKDMKTVKEKGLHDYLNSINSWIGDMEGYYINTKQQIPDIDWNILATILYVGKIYE